MEFALPAWAGHWVDGRLGTRPWVTLLGVFLGIAAGTVHLIQIARTATPPKPGLKSPDEPKPQ